MTARKALAWTMIAALAALPLAAPAHASDKGDAKDEGPAWLGVRLQRVEGGLADALDLENDAGVLIGQVMDDSPASKAGLASGDVVTRVGDEKVGTPSELRDAIASKHAGDKVTVTVLRSGHEKKIDVVLGEAPEPHGLAAEAFDHARRGMDRVRDLRLNGKHGFLGVMTEDLTGDLGEYFGAKDGGALVTQVVDDSPAQKLGLKAGDVITSVDGKEIEDASDLRSEVGKHQEEGDQVEVVWLRDKKKESGKVTLEVREGMGMLGMGEGPHFFQWRDDDFDLPRFHDHMDGARRVVVEKFRDDDDLRNMIRKLQNDVQDLKDQLEELKSD